MPRIRELTFEEFEMIAKYVDDTFQSPRLQTEDPNKQEFFRKIRTRLIHDIEDEFTSHLIPSVEVDPDPLVSMSDFLRIMRNCDPTWKGEIKEQ